VLDVARFPVDRRHEQNNAEQGAGSKQP
jgi:hypothetical protein